MRTSDRFFSREQELCVSCGLCCNGVIFADLKLRRGETFPLASVLVGYLESRRTGHRPHQQPGSKIPQPCPALEGCRCTVYEDRPRHCRDFECLLLKRVKAGQMGVPSAQYLIRKTRNQAKVVTELLRLLGDTDEQLPLAARFRRTSSRLDRIGAAGEGADHFQELTVGVHELTLLLSQEFYSG